MVSRLAVDDPWLEASLHAVRCLRPLDLFVTGSFLTCVIAISLMVDSTARFRRKGRQDS